MLNFKIKLPPNKSSELMSALIGTLVGSLDCGCGSGSDVCSCKQ
jgi:hypothetical protein